MTPQGITLPEIRPSTSQERIVQTSPSQELLQSQSQPAITSKAPSRALMGCDMSQLLIQQTDNRHGHQNDLQPTTDQNKKSVNTSRPANNILGRSPIPTMGHIDEEFVPNTELPYSTGVPTGVEDVFLTQPIGPLGPRGHRSTRWQFNDGLLEQTGSCPSTSPYSWMIENPGKIPAALHPPVDKTAYNIVGEIEVEHAIRTHIADPVSWFMVTTSIKSLMRFRAVRL